MGSWPGVPQAQGTPALFCDRFGEKSWEVSCGGAGSKQTQTHHAPARLQVSAPPPWNHREALGQWELGPAEGPGSEGLQDTAQAFGHCSEEPCSPGAVAMVEVGLAGGSLTVVQVGWAGAGARLVAVPGLW